ncbi:MAG: VOC family protein [Actinomycetota bacterium]
MPRVVHFEIHADDPVRAVEFYSKVFGWVFQKWDGPLDYWMITTGEPDAPGVNGGLVKRMGPPPQEGQAVNAYPCTIDVSSVDAYCESVTANGGSIALPKMPIPGIGWLAYGKDTEGNIFGMMQMEAQTPG